MAKPARKGNGSKPRGEKGQARHRSARPVIPDPSPLVAGGDYSDENLLARAERGLLHSLHIT
ncbi:hypothetical protein C4578_01270 [Candidatus Microgenomates bacterium]|nr:MAG: hypothetical protein C4578_01270 [Candidatus Microgenomates bacterium]